MRHRRDIQSNFSLNKPLLLKNSTLDNSLLTTNLYLPLINTVPLGTVNGTVDEIIFVTESSSIRLNEGYIETNILSDIQFKFGFQSFIYFRESYSPLISIEGTDSLEDIALFTVSYNHSLQKFILLRYITTSTYDIRYLNCPLSLNTWYHVSINRNYNNLNLFIDGTKILEITDYYHSIPNGKLTVGRENTSYLNANLTNIQFSSEPLNTTSSFTNINLNAYKQTKLETNIDSELGRYRVINLERYDSCSNVLLRPYKLTNNESETRYDVVNKYWIVIPSNIVDYRTNTKGLCFIGNITKFHPREFTLELGFKLPEVINEDVIIFSHWKNIPFNYYYLVYRKDLNVLQFIYTKVSSNVAFSFNLSDINKEYTNHFVLQVSTNLIEIYLNGIRLVTLNDFVKIPDTLDYQFNYNVDNNINSSTELYLQYFVLSNVRKYNSANYIANNPTTSVDIIPVTNHIVKYHSIESSLTTRMLDSIDFNVAGTFNIQSGTVYTYTINQKGTRLYNTKYYVWIEIIDKTELSSSNYVLSSSEIIISGNSISSTFTLLINLTSINIYKGKFKLCISNNYITKTYDCNIIDSYTVVLTGITSMSNYIDGYIVKETNNPSIFYNITNSRNASTTALYVNNEVYGYGYKISTINDSIDFPLTYTGIRTIFFVYKELNEVTNRTYIGDSSQYTFNGGVNGEIVGNLVLNPTDYVKIKSHEYKSSVVKISKDDSAYIVTDEVTSKVYIGTKDDEDRWKDTLQELVLDLDTTNYDQTDVIDNASLWLNSTGTVAVIGLKNADNGEGIIQVWRLQESGWTKDLHLGSPIPSPYYGGFGTAIACTDDGNTLFVSELGANNGTENKVYEFKKTDGVWSAIPTYTFNGTNNYGYNISVSANGTYLAIHELDTNLLKIYKFTTNWNLLQTISDVQSFEFTSDFTTLITSKYTIGQCKLYELNSDSYSLIKTLTKSTFYGISVSVDNNRDILIGSPVESKVYLYKADDAWTEAIEFVSTTESDYGFYVSKSVFSNVISNFDSIIDLYTNDGTSITQNIVSLRVNRAVKTLETDLGSELQLLVFQSATGLNISHVGKGKSETSLDGIFLGVVMFSRLLTGQEIETVENTLLRYLDMIEYGFLRN